MISSTARQFISVRRGLSSSYGKSLVLGGVPSSRHAVPNANAFVLSKRSMSSPSGDGGWWSKNIPGFGSKPITPEQNISEETIITDSAVTPMSNSTSTGAPSGSDGFPSVDESMSKIIPDYGSNDIALEAGDNAVATTTDTATLIAEQMAAFEPTWWPSDQALIGLNWVHETAGFPCYAYAIGATTLAFRAVLFPLFVKGQRNSSRMAHMQPELKVMRDEVDKLGKKVDQATQMRVQKQTRALFQKYDCNPLLSIAAPLASAPIFMSMFFALRTAPDYFPTLLETGGMLWFPDLTAADPYCAMPLMSAATFLLMTEVGKEQMMASDPARS